MDKSSKRKYLPSRESISVYRELVDLILKILTLITIVFAIVTGFGVFSTQVVWTVVGVLVTLSALSLRSLVKHLTLPKEGFIIERKEAIYQYYADRKKMRFITKYRLRAVINGLEMYTDRYKWSGHGELQLTTVGSGVTLRGPYIDGTDVWNLYDVIFPSKLNKDECIDFETEMSLYDESGEAVPFLASIIRHPIEYLVLRVVLPSEQPPEKIEFKYWPPYHETSDPVTSPGMMDRVTGEIRYEVKKPRLYSRHAIVWSWGEKIPDLIAPHTPVTTQTPREKHEDTVLEAEKNDHR